MSWVFSATQILSSSLLSISGIVFVLCLNAVNSASARDFCRLARTRHDIATLPQVRPYCIAALPRKRAQEATRCSKHRDLRARNCKSNDIRHKLTRMVPAILSTIRATKSHTESYDKLGGTLPSPLGRDTQHKHELGSAVVNCQRRLSQPKVCLIRSSTPENAQLSCNS